jgi:ribosomal protein S18 acetylase RimI-like enzyme
MHADEADAVAALLVAANEEHLAQFPPAVADAYRTELLDVASRTAERETFVLHVDGRLAGSVSFVADAQGDTHPWPPGGSVLRFLAVRPAARGQRLGERLATVCIDLARERSSIFLGLHTAPSMHAARRVYEQLGFERAPEHDFDPDAHYGRAQHRAEPPWGLAYVLRLEPAGG